MTGVIIRFKPVAFKAAPKKVQKDLISIREQSIKTGASKGVKQFLPKVALKTGQLRTTIEEMINNQLRNLNRRTIIEIIFDFAFLEQIPYSKFHIRGLELAFPLGKYKDPTTKGTEPILPQVLMFFHVQTKITQELKRRMKGKKLSFTKFIKIQRT